MKIHSCVVSVTKEWSGSWVRRTQGPRQGDFPEVVRSEFNLRICRRLLSKKRRKKPFEKREELT